MSIKNVFPQIASFDSILAADRDVRAGKRFDNEELSFWGDYETNLHDLADAVSNLDFPPDTYRSFYVYEPKLRKIICSDYRTKVIQRAVYNAVNPLVCNGFITDTYSCVKERGQINAMKRLASWVDYVSSGPGTWYYLKMDVEKFFYRIDHDILMKEIRKKISDRRTIRIMEHYICEASKPFGLPLGVKDPMDVPEKDMLWNVGITIGGGMSHMHGNMYLNPLDQLAKRSFGIRYYIRYMDDIIILSDNKDELHKYKKEISNFLNDCLRLRLNNKTAIRPVTQGIEFVGFRIWPYHVRLRKGTSLRMKRHLYSVQEKYRRNEMSFYQANATVMSYLALMKHCDCKNLQKSIFDKFVLTHALKEAIS